MSESATLEDIRKMVAEQFGPEYTVVTAVHADGEAYSVNVMKGTECALRAQSPDLRRSLGMMAEALNRLWAVQMTRQFGHCSQ